MCCPKPRFSEQEREELGLWPVIVPQGTLPEGVWIPDEFERVVLLHVVKNHIPELTPPLILAIQGPQGEGKSFQTRAVCSKRGIYVIPISGSLLSGSFEGDSVNTLQKAYIYASLVRQKINRMVVLLIDDFDLSVASTFEGRRYTVNAQLLSGFMMNLVDDPTKCGEHSTYRIPIIVTGNNFTSLHSPLMRHGRMNFFDWQPSLEQKKRMVYEIFRPILPFSRHAFDKFVERFGNEPISFFAALKDDLIDHVILQAMNEFGADLQRIRQVVVEFSRKETGGRLDEVGKRILGASPLLKRWNITISTLVELAEIRQNRNAKNYIERKQEMFGGNNGNGY